MEVATDISPSYGMVHGIFHGNQLWDNYDDFSPITWETHPIINYFKHHLSGWWFGTMAFYDFPFSWECHHPNWRTPSFFRGVGSTTNQLRIVCYGTKHFDLNGHQSYQHYQPVTIRGIFQSYSWLVPQSLGLLIYQIHSGNLTVRYWKWHIYTWFTY